MEDRDLVEAGAEEVLVQVHIQTAMDMRMVRRLGLSIVTSLAINPELAQCLEQDLQEASRRDLVGNGLTQHLEQVLQEVNRRDLVGSGLIQRLEPLVRIQAIIQTIIQTQDRIRVHRIMQRKELGRKHERRPNERRKSERPKRLKRRERRIWRSG
jgi:hypothetical protein